MATVKLHAKPGLVSLHFGGAEHTVDADGRVELPEEHVETALSLGCTREPPVRLANPVEELAELKARVGALEARVAVLEAAAEPIAEAGGKKK